MILRTKIFTRFGCAVVDTRWVDDCGCFETMVFHCDKNGEITDHFGIDSNRYCNQSDAEQGHNEMIKKWSI